MEIKQQLHSLVPYQPGKPIEDVKKEYDLETIYKLASNENPYGCSPLVLQELKNQFDLLSIYPDGYSSDLREVVANHLKIQKAQLIFGNGSDELIQIISRAFLHANTNTVMATPTFPQYKHNAIIEGAEIREVQLVNGEHDLEAMLKQIDGLTRVVWICTPNNPTGVSISKEALYSFIERVPKTTLIVIDEAYYEYVDDEDYPDMISSIDSYENMIVLRTFSKAYGLASLRIGYGVASDKLIKKIEPARQPFNTSRFAQAAAIAAISDQPFVLECRKKNRQGLQQFYDFCENNNLAYFQSKGNFILIDFISISGDEVFHYLLERGFIVRSGSSLGFPTAVRITIGDIEVNERLLNTLSGLLKDKKQLTIG